MRLLDIGSFRVRWDRYARDNGNVGLTALSRENVTLQGLHVRSVLGQGVPHLGGTVLAAVALAREHAAGKRARCQ